jgi:hypothetical protein
MPSLPDIPGKNFVGGTTRRARMIAAAAGAGALAAGGFVAKRVMDARTGGGDGDAGPGPAVAERPPPVAKPKPSSGPKPTKPAAPPKADKPKSAAPNPAAPKADKPKPSKPKAAKPKASKSKPAKAKAGTPPATTGTDAPTVPGAEPGDQRGGKDPHHALNYPVGDPDLTEYPDPFDKRDDPRDPDGPFGEAQHPATGAESTSEPPPSQDPEVGDRARPPRRDNLDD